MTKFIDLTETEQMELFKQEKEWETGKEEVSEVEIFEFEAWRLEHMLSECWSV